MFGPGRIIWRICYALIAALLQLCKTICLNVKVTLILDAILVVLVGELISLWYREFAPMEVVLSLGVIIMLTLLRIVTVKYTPEIELGAEEDKNGATSTTTGSEAT